LYSGKPDDQITMKTAPTVQAPTKDDAYDSFMKEMEGLLWEVEGLWRGSVSTGTLQSTWRHWSKHFLWNSCTRCVW